MKKISLSFMVTCMLLLFSCTENATTSEIDATPDTIVTTASTTELKPVEQIIQYVKTEETTIPEIVFLPKIPDELPEDLKNQVNIEYDSMDEFTIIQAKKPALKSFYAYIYTDNNNQCGLFLSMTVTSDKTLDTSRIKFKSGGNVLEFEINPESLDKDSFTNNYGTYYVEHVFRPLSSENIIALRSVIGSETTAVRFAGADKSRDTELSDQEKEAIALIIECYNYLTDNTY